MLRIDGQSFAVYHSGDRGLSSDDGSFRVLGQVNEAENTILLEGNLPSTRQEEVLLHEMFHVAMPHLWESDINALGNRVHGFLANNGMLNEGFLERVMDGPAPPHVIDSTIDNLNRVVAGEADTGMRLSASGTIAARATVADATVDGDDETGSAGQAPPDLVDGGGDSPPGGSAAGGEQDVGAALRARDREKVRAQRAEARLRELEKREEQRAQAEESELQKAHRERDEARQAAEAALTAARESSDRAAFVSAATAVGCLDADLLFSGSRAQIDGLRDADGSLSREAIDDFLAETKARRAYLFGSAGGNRPIQRGDAAATGDAPADKPADLMPKDPARREVAQAIYDGMGLGR